MQRKIPTKFLFLEAAALGAGLGLQTAIFQYASGRNGSTTFFNLSGQDSTKSTHDSAENTSFSKKKPGK